MTTPEDRLRELFQSNQEPIPDVTRVYVGSLARARVHRRRRRAAQLAGGAAVTAGIAVGAVGLSGELTPRHAAPTVIAVAGQPTADPSAAVAASVAATTSDTPSPSTTASAVGTTTAPASGGSSENEVTPTAAQLNYVLEFFSKGYTYDDAVKLAQVWTDTKTPYDAKIEGGRKLRAGDQLPIGPSKTADWTGAHEADSSAFVDAGYTYEDATRLAALWKSPSVNDAKVLAGQKLLAGKPLPTQP